MGTNDDRSNEINYEKGLMYNKSHLPNELKILSDNKIVTEINLDKRCLQ